MKNLLIKSAIASGVFLTLATVTRPAMATSFTVSVENPGVENTTSSLGNAHVENFNGLTPGYSSTGFTWTSDGTPNGQVIGTYKNTLIENADQFGGAGGTAQYFDVDTNRSANNQTVSTLNFTTPESYFGLWWSAGDANNVLTFLSKGQIVQTVTTADVINYISNNASYKGNPDLPFKGQDGGEPFAFINFYDTTGTFDQIQFTNIGLSGFESDNHTVATSYNNITGNVVVKATPEPSSILGVLGIGVVGAASVLTRRGKKNSVLQSS